MKKNIYFHTNLLAWTLVLLLVSNYVFGWTTPTQNPPDGDLSAPLDVSSSGQTKTGNLTIDSLFKVGRYSSAPSGSTGALYYDTTENELKVYKASSWTVLAGTAPVSSVFGRTGDVTATSGDYSVGNITGAAPLASPTFTGSVTMPGTGIWNSSGNVGIGTTSPGYKLDVVSGGSTTARFGTAASDEVTIGSGSGKLTVGTIDPIYTINDKQYATYMAGMIGVKEEITGILEMNRNEVGVNGNKLFKETIDFNNLEEGSDLWLFAKITNLKENFDKMIVLLTPAFNGKIWYKKGVYENYLTIFAISDSVLDSNLEISYRFTAPRFDFNKWTNYSDSECKGFNLDELLE